MHRKQRHDRLLEVDNLGKRFGGFVALESIALSVRPGERIGLIGPNGSGKSDAGQLHLRHAPKRTGLGEF